MADPTAEKGDSPVVAPPSPVLVHLVGAGPGDPGLLTLKGAEALRNAEVVLYDHLAHPRLLDLAPASALRIDAGKQVGHYAMRQEAIEAALIEHARAGRRVVRLKGGDPYVFGRGAEEAQALFAAGIPFAVVPGVTAGLGATSYAGLAATHRQFASAVAFVTGHEPPWASPLDWPALARFPGTLVIYMGSSHLEAIRDVLIAHGKPPGTPAAAVQAGALPRQRVVQGHLNDLPELFRATGLGAPCLFMVGEVVGLREALAWYERLPLFGRRVVVTRPRADLAEASASLESLGAEAVAAPMVELGPVEPGPDRERLDHALRRLANGGFDWLVLTSANGARFLVERLDQLGLDLRALGRTRLAAIGQATARALEEFHIRPDLAPESARSEEFAQVLRPEVAGRAVLLTRADRGRSLLPDQLAEVAREVENVWVYRHRDAEALPPGLAARLETAAVDWVTLTSPATARRFLELTPEAARDHLGRTIRLAAISPLTAQACRDQGYEVAAVAKPFTWDGLIRAILAAERGDPNDAPPPTQKAWPLREPG